MTLDGPRRTEVPIPDPTELTTQQLDKAIENLREILEMRLDAMDLATKLRMDQVTDIPAMVRREIAHLEELHSERFRLVDEKYGAIGMRFDERDVRTAQAAETSQKALDAALLAAAALVRQQNEANAAAAEKVELSFTKQLDQVVQQIQSEGKAKDLRISEIKERLDRGDGSTTGAQAQRTETRAISGGVYALIGLLVMIAGILITIFALKG